jgi:hypothetical protein
MARPASRYFVPVIRKISEMKKAENIRIDERFKAELRGELILRMGLNETGAKAVKRENAGSAESFMEGGLADFFRKWKYQLALAPVALVLMLVAVQSFKLPVKMESETVVPTAAVKNEDAGGPEAEAVAVSTMEGATEEVTEESMPDGEGLLMTKAVLSEGGPVEEVGSGTGSTGMPVVVEEVDAEQGVSRTAQTQTTQQNVDAVPYKATPYKAEPTMIIAPAVIEPVTEKKPGTAAGDVPAGATDVQTTVPVVNKTIVTVPAATDVAEPAAPARVMLEEVPKLDVYYDPSFSGVKDILEKNLLTGLMKDGGYDYASVSQADDGVVTVSLSSVDGSSVKKMFRLNVRTNAWDEVVYVEKYYYDDSLRYERLDLSLPVYPDRFDDTDHYRYGY